MSGLKWVWSQRQRQWVLGQSIRDNGGDVLDIVEVEGVERSYWPQVSKWDDVAITGNPRPVWSDYNPSTTPNDTADAGDVIGSTLPTTISVDTISEQTTDGGVTIDGVAIQDGQVDGVDVAAHASRHFQDGADPVRIGSATGEAVDVVNTVTATTVFTYTVPSGAMGANGFVDVTVLGDVLRNKGDATGNLRIIVTWGGTTIYDDTVGWSADNASRNALYFWFRIYNQASASLQGLTGFFNIGVAGGATTGIGNIDQDEVESSGAVGADQTAWAGDVDTASSSAAVAVQFKWTVADANLSARMLHADAVVVKVS